MSEIQELELTRRPNIDLERLNFLIENHPSGTRNGPARVILIGKAPAECTELGIKEKTYHIDVVLDLQATGERLLQIRQCMAQDGVFREFDRPELDTKEDWRTLFGTSAYRTKVFKDVLKEENCVFSEKHLKAYVMDAERALEFELRRMDYYKVSGDTTKETTSLDLAAAILSGIRPIPMTLNYCRNLKHMRVDTCVSKDSMDKVNTRFNSIHQKH